MTVTDVVLLDRKKSRVYIDGEYAFPLYASELAKFGIKVGADLSEDAYSAITELLIKRVKERILYLINDMDRTERDIRDRLYRFGYTVSVVDGAIESLRPYGYIDDVRYVQRYIESVQRNGCRSRMAIESFLYGKGVSGENIREGMKDIVFDEEEQIIRALKRKGFSPDEIADASADTKRKLYGYLARKGFSADSISNIIRK